MPNTYILIASNTLASAVTSVTFSSIPATYTDLVVKTSHRTAQFGAVGATSRLSFNGVATVSYSNIGLRQDGATVITTRNFDNNYFFIDTAGNGDSATANNFGNTEIYIPSYLASRNKQLYSQFIGESNQNNLTNGQAAFLFRNTSAITSLTLESNSGSNYLVGSSFYLYGIKNT
jgi:hypothetical protein